MTIVNPKSPDTSLDSREELDGQALLFSVEDSVELFLAELDMVGARPHSLAA